ncbi:MAG: type II secretion system F family protein [Candidatus Aenigmatarchaeota archaeon]
MSEYKGLKSWIMQSKKRWILISIPAIIGISIILLNFFVLSLDPRFFMIINLIGGSLVMGPSLLVQYKSYQAKKEIENRFPDFLEDIVQGTKSGMSLPQSIKSTSNNDYGELNPYVEKMSLQIDWGIPFSKILRNFSKEIESKVLSRATSTIIETHRSGGNISDVLEAVGDSILEIEKIKKERKAHVYSQMVTGYMIFFVFLGVILGLQLFLIPSLSVKSGSLMSGGGISMDVSMLQDTYKNMFRHLIIIQGLFSGLAIGKMSEGTIMGGFKHSIVLVAIGYSVFTLAPLFI